MTQDSVPPEKIYLDDTTHLLHSLRPPFLKGGGGWEILALKQKGVGLEKILKRGGSIQKGVPLLKGGLGNLR